ncbi:hypothetical protein BJ085DRAFT_27694 [Dimargaris cristalligena]|uniref:Uncharacterized protein n=1 Tax=Dimargaris cristalligena TaxID=215637 RepID=A0A4P9ZVR8_9FUNG|nr:hypothetical protein BJ085DRAFT_27694 [Dimargaris cristalligena]|eukprot:RKP37705.1 hypothetical protein BJ085DRAFT_27694 [Dimargaris cristalligena]
MRSSFLSVSVVGMALANFTTSFPHGIGSVNTAVGGKPAPQLLRRALGEKRQDATGSSGYGQDYKRMKPLARNLMENDNDIMKMVRSEADYSAFLTTFSLPEYIPSSLLTRRSLAILFPMVARALKAGTGEIPELDMLIARVNSSDYGPDHDSLSSGLPGLISTNLPNNLARQTLSSLPYLVQGHLAAHFVINNNLEGLKGIIRSWIANPQELVQLPGFDDALFEFTHAVTADDDMGTSADQMSLVEDLLKGTYDPYLYVDVPKFDPKNNDPLDTRGDLALYDNKARWSIVTLFAWAMEYQMDRVEELFAEFGNPFRNRDFPCLVTLEYYFAFTYLNPMYSESSRFLSSREQFSCFQNFSFQGYVTLSPSSNQPDEVLIRVRHNHQLTPQIEMEPADDNSTFPILANNLQQLFGFIDNSDARPDINIRIGPIHAWAESLNSAIEVWESIHSSNTEDSPNAVSDSAGPTSAIPGNLVSGANKIAQLAGELVTQVKLFKDNSTPEYRESNPVATNDMDGLLNILRNHLLVLSEKYLFKAVIQEGLSWFRAEVGDQKAWP